MAPWIAPSLGLAEFFNSLSRDNDPRSSLSKVPSSLYVLSGGGADYSAVYSAPLTNFLPFLSRAISMAISSCRELEFFSPLRNSSIPAHDVRVVFRLIPDLIFMSEITVFPSSCDHIAVFSVIPVSR